MRFASAAFLVLLLLASVLWAPSTVAQFPIDAMTPPSSGGVARLDPLLARLASHRRLLMIAAHPDDEDTRLLALVSRGLGGDAAYLSLSRGEGGQNLIGPELGVGLGLIRSRELLAARTIDGARQFFSRAYDFGYTRSLDEALSRWPREALLEDAVRVVRRFKPQLVVTVWTADRRAGHGQHQAAGWLAERVAEAAADPARFPDAGAPWRVEAVDLLTWGDAETTERRVPLGVLEPVSGRSVVQIAMASRSRHRSQDMGVVEPLGDAESTLRRITGSPTPPGDDSLFAGMDTRLPAIAYLLEPGVIQDAVARRLGRAAVLARATRGQIAPQRLADAIDPLIEIAGLLDAAGIDLRSVPDDPAAAQVASLLSEKRALVDEALATAAGVAVDAWADREAVVPGDSVHVHTDEWAPGFLGSPASRSSIELVAPAGWRVVTDQEAAPRRGRFRTRSTAHGRFEVSVAPDAPASAPEFLRRPRDGDLYDWHDVAPEQRGEPFASPVLRARWTIWVSGMPVVLEREVVFRTADQAVGEVRRPLRIVPRYEISATPASVVWPLARGGRPTITVRVDRSPVARDGAEGEGEAGNDPAGEVVRLVMTSEGDGSVVFESELSFAGRSTSQEIQVALPSPSAGEQRYRLAAVDRQGRRYEHAYPVLEAPHIRPTPMPVAAAVTVRAGEITLPTLDRVAYVRGAADRVPEALSAIGVPLEVLDATALAETPLERYDAVVIGSRAYEVEPALAAANERLLDYVRAGGRLIVQYQQYAFVRGGFAPYPFDIGRPHDRTTDEDAPVRILVPGHPVLRSPNVIGEDDWTGWVQERGLYFAGTWDDAYQPLLAMADPEGVERHGALLVADLGAGQYIYTGLAFFRQLPAGVLGAYRLFANLLGSGAELGAHEPATVSRRSSRP